MVVEEGAGWEGGLAGVGRRGRKWWRDGGGQGRWVDGLGDGDKVGGVGDVDEAVVKVLVGAFGGVELAVVDPDVGALLGKGVGGVRRCPGEGGLGLAHVDGHGIAVGGDDGCRLDVADDDVLLLLDLQADTGEAWGKGAVVRGGCLAWGQGWVGSRGVNTGTGETEDALVAPHPNLCAAVDHALDEDDHRRRVLFRDGCGELGEGRDGCHCPPCAARGPVIV